MTRRYRIRCGSCAAVLGVRVVNLRRLHRLVGRHRLTGCAGLGLLVRPLAKEAA